MWFVGCTQKTIGSSSNDAPLSKGKGLKMGLTIYGLINLKSNILNGSYLDQVGLNPQPLVIAAALLLSHPTRIL